MESTAALVVRQRTSVGERRVKQVETEKGYLPIMPHDPSARFPGLGISRRAGAQIRQYVAAMGDSLKRSWFRVRRQHPPSGRPLRVDPAAVSADPGLPAFIARPTGAPVYHGFPILEDVEVDGFRLGMITDFLSSPDTEGDAFVVTPDKSRCGLVWESEVDCAYFNQVLAPEEDRWGVWAVGLPLPLTTIEDARLYLQALLPELRARWESWSSKM
jgi:hypothetical protein